MPDRRFTFTGEGRIDDDEEEKNTPGRPNAWWAANKDSIKDAGEAAATYDGAVTATRQGSHGGERAVTPSDVLGSVDYCWCGLPFDHDYPGKDRGRKHPKEMSEMPATSSTDQRIERRQLRAYNDDLVDVITEAVNGYHAKYRLQKNGIVLFPPDGTQGITLNARNSARQVKTARLWFLRHCVGVGEDGKPENPLVADAAVLEEDHERRTERVEQENRAEAREVLEVMKQDPENPANSSVDRSEPEPWVPYVGSDGEANEFFETNGTIIRCRVCNGTESAYETESPRGIGGHIRIRHRDTTNMYDTEARAKALESRRFNRLSRDVRLSVEMLSKAIGYEAPVDTSEVEALKAENAVLLKRAEDAEARIALMREAMGA